MSSISTARETLARLDMRISREKDERRRRWFEVHRQHWWGEVTCDLEMIMSTMSHGPIRYSMDGHPFMAADPGLAAVCNWEDTRNMYEAIIASEVRLAGSLDAERIAVDEQGLIVHCILTAVYPGKFLNMLQASAKADALYLIRWPGVTLLRFDDDDLMNGEDVINGAPLLIREVTAEWMDLIVDGPLPAIPEKPILPPRTR